MRLFVRFGIPLRNNHLSQPEPAEIEHGAAQYYWDGYLWWTDSVADPLDLRTRQQSPSSRGK